MRLRTRCLSTVSSWTTSTLALHRVEFPLSKRWTRRVGIGRALRLFYRRTPLPQVIKQTTIRQTVRQTIVHLHQAVLQRHTHQKYLSANYLRQDAFLFVLPRERAVRPEPDDPSRPARTAQRLLRIFSKESVRREMRPFYSGVVRNVFQEEQERYRSRPAQAISLIWNLFGRQQAFRTLTRFYMSAVEKLGSNYYPALNGPNALFLATGILLHSRVYQQYVRQFWHHEAMELPVRYTPREQIEDLSRLHVVHHMLPPREVVEQMATEPLEPVQSAPETAGRPIRLSEADFRTLVQGVAQSLSRETRLEALRRGRF